MAQMTAMFHRPVTRVENPPLKIVLSLLEKYVGQFKTIGHSPKNLGPSRKSLRPSWCPKLVTGLVFQ